MECTWKYEGDISSYTTNRNLRGEIIIEEIQLYDIDDCKKAPIMLHVGASLFNYIEDIEGHDDEEKYMRKVFHYDSILYLRKIEILNKDGQVCKIIEEYDDVNWLAKVTGPAERINDRNQKALTWQDKEDPHQYRIISGKIEG